MRPPLRLLEEPYRSRAVRAGTPEHWSWLFAAPDCREPLLAVYALMAEWRVLMDPATEVTVARVKLAWWHEEMQRLAHGQAVHPVSRYLMGLPGSATTDHAPLERAVEAAIAQVAGAPLEHSSELAAHSGSLWAGPLGVAAELAGPLDATAKAGVGKSLAALAEAIYLTDAIACYRRQSRAGRVVFPVEDLLTAQVEDVDLAAAEPPPHLRSYLERSRSRAAGAYATAAAVLPRAERNTLRHILVLAALGRKHLNSRRSGARDAFKWRDLWLAWSAARRGARS